MSFWDLYCYLGTGFTYCSSVSIFKFEQVSLYFQNWIRFAQCWICFSFISFLDISCNYFQVCGRNMLRVIYVAHIPSDIKFKFSDKTIENSVTFFNISAVFHYCIFGLQISWSFPVLLYTWSKQGFVKRFPWLNSQTLNRFSYWWLWRQG